MPKLNWICPQRVERGRKGFGVGERRCLNKTVTMAKCAPINCHFVLADGGGKECMSTNKLANVSMPYIVYNRVSNWMLALEIRVF